MRGVVDGDAMTREVDGHHEGENQDQRCVQRGSVTIDDAVHPENYRAIHRGNTVDLGFECCAGWLHN